MTHDNIECLREIEDILTVSDCHFSSADVGRAADEIEVLRGRSVLLQIERDQAVEELERALDEIANLHRKLAAVLEMPAKETVISSLRGGGCSVQYFRRQGYSKTQAKVLALYTTIRRNCLT